MYISGVYGRTLEPDVQWRIIRAKLFEAGHSFESIDNTKLQDMIDYLGFLDGRSKVNKKQQAEKKKSKSSPTPRRRRRR